MAALDMSFAPITFWKANFRIREMQINVLNYLTLNELVISEIEMGMGKRRVQSSGMITIITFLWIMMLSSIHFGFEFSCWSETMSSIAMHMRCISSFNFMSFHWLHLLYADLSPRGASCECICLRSFLWFQLNNGFVCMLATAKTIDGKIMTKSILRSEFEELWGLI